MQIRFGSTVKKALWIGLVLLLATLIVTPSVTRSVDPAPDFTIPTTSGEEFHLQENRSEPVILEFMTPRCISCKKVAGHMSELYPDYKDEFTFLSIDVSGSDMDVLKDHKQAEDIPWEIGKGNDSLAIDKYGVNTVPTVIIIDAEGYVTFKEKGELGKDKIEDEMKAVLGGEADRIELQQYGIYTLAVIGGFASFFSPCSFPLLPSYIAYYIRPDEEEDGSDEEENEEKKLGFKGLSLGGQAAAGIVVVFGAVGAIAVSGGRWISLYIPYLEPIVGGIILVLGAFLLADVDIGARLSLISFKLKKKLGMDVSSSNTHSSPFFYGLGYGSSSAGCTAPVFIAVVLSSWLSGGLSEAVMVLILYLSVMAALMIVFSVLTIFFREKIMKKMKGAIKWINLGSGVVLVAAGAYLIYQFIITL